jgi:SpoVK/Ycf46/Vps4 family AAA+-type ATPase
MLGDNTQVAVVSSDAMDSRGGTVLQTVIPLRPLGGVRTQLKLVTDAVQAILAEPDKTKRRRQPVNGILLFGPAGTGKSLLAETVSRSVPAAHRQVVAGPELYSKYLGETEAQLRQVFAAAMRSAPAVIVLEDLDSLAPRRESGGGGSDLERRLTVTLQTLLDRLGQDQSRNKERLFVNIT